MDHSKPPNGAASQKKHVVFVINDFLVGGAQRQLTRQLSLYDKDAFRFSIITLFDFAGRPTLYDRIPPCVAVHRLAFRGAFDVRGIWSFIRLVRAIRPDLVVSSLFLANTLCRSLKPFFRYRSIAREHNTYIDKPRVAILIDRLLARVSDRMVAVSQSVAAFTSRQQRLPAGCFTVIPNGIDLGEIRAAEERLRPTAKRDVCLLLGITPEIKIMLNVARLTPQKNQDALIRAFADFVVGHPDYVLCILGGGGRMEALTALVHDLGLERHVFLLGSISSVEAFYLASDVFVSASFIEGMSNAQLEALAYGLPMIVTRTGGVEELLREGENGFAVNGFTAADIRRGLERFAAVSSPGHLRQAARATAEAYDIRKTVAAYERLFHDCLAR